MVRIISEPRPRAPVRRPRPKARLLLVDDNPQLRALLQRHLEREGYAVRCAKDGVEGLTSARRHKPHLLIVDLAMPRLDGLEMLKTLRQESQAPVMVLTARRGDLNQILGLKLGADDFVFKPFCAEVLTARIEALLRRTAASDGSKGLARLGALTVDPDKREVCVGGQAVGLTIKEFDVLKALIDARGKVLSRDHLLSAVWRIGEDSDIRTRTVDQHVAGIRQKLGPEGSRIMTVPHFGYRIRLA